MLNKIHVCLLSIILPSILCVERVSAATQPDAGSLRQDIERKGELPQPKKESTTIAPTQKPKTAPQGVMVTVKSFRFTGNTIVSEKELSEAVAPLLNHPIAFAELETVNTLVAESYRKVGLIARAFFPPQDANSGVISVTVVESVFGEARVNGDEPKRIHSDRLVKMVSAQQEKGALLSSDALDSAIRRINELPGVGVSGALNAGQQANETDLLLNVSDKSMVTGNLTLDNSGSAFTGEQRAIGTIFLNSPFAYGEQMSATLLHSSGTDYGQLAATMPVGYSGMRVGTHASALSYKIVSGFDALGASGSSSAFGLDASYPLVRARTQNFSLSLALDNASFENDTLVPVTVTKYNVSELSTSVGGYLFDEFAGGGVNQMGLGLIAGDAKADDANTSTQPDKGVKGAGSFTKIHYALSRQQHITETFSLYGSIAGQVAGNNLTSSEKFTLGGASGVRAYTSTEGSGDSGNIVTIEVRARLPYNMSVTGFYDAGNITVDKEITSNSSAENSYSLKGAGLSVGWSSSMGVNLKATFASQVGTNPLPPSQTTTDKSHVWIQASMSF